MKKIDLKEIIKNQNKYIALNKEKSKILASASSIQELEKKLSELNIKNTILKYVPPVRKHLSPYADNKN